MSPRQAVVMMATMLPVFLLSFCILRLIHAESTVLCRSYPSTCGIWMQFVLLYLNEAVSVLLLLVVGGLFCPLVVRSWQAPNQRPSPQ